MVVVPYAAHFQKRRVSISGIFDDRILLLVRALVSIVLYATHAFKVAGECAGLFIEVEDC